MQEADGETLALCRVQINTRLKPSPEGSKSALCSVHLFLAEGSAPGGQRPLSHTSLSKPHNLHFSSTFRAIIVVIAPEMATCTFHFPHLLRVELATGLCLLGSSPGSQEDPFATTSLLCALDVVGFMCER